MESHIPGHLPYPPSWNKMKDILKKKSNQISKNILQEDKGLEKERSNIYHKKSPPNNIKKLGE